MTEERIEARIESLQNLILDVLRDHPEGLREFDLIQALAERGEAGCKRHMGRDQLSMFQSHFLLFHCLYRLRDRLRASGEAELEIHCLNIALRPWRGGTGPALVGADPLRDYYLDLAHLTQTTAEDVAALLESFWRRFSRRDDDYRRALRELELDEAASFDEIRSQYRRLVMRHHPDRGGDTTKLQALNRAMDHLRRRCA